MAKTLVPKSFKASVDRALHNLYTEKATTLHPMTAVPIFYRRMFKGDTFDFGILESILRSEPTYAPLLSNWRLRFEWYFDSDANRYGWIDNNTRLTAQEVMTRKHHRYVTWRYQNEMDSFDKDFVIGKGGVADYAGIAPGFVYVDGMNEAESLTPNSSFGNTFNVDFHLTYLNIIRNYHVNRQFTQIPYIGNLGAYTDLELKTYSLDDLDNLFVFLRSCPNGVLFNREEVDAPTQLSDYYNDAIIAFRNYLIASEGNYSGLFCTQYEPDLYQNILNGDENLLRSVIKVHNTDEGLGFTVDEFRLGNHLQSLFDKVFVSGGTDSELSRMIWGIESSNKYDIPELLCVHSEIIGTNLVTSSTAGNATTSQGEQIRNYAGSMSGNVNTRRGAGRQQRFTAKTSGSLMCIVSLTPLVSYCQNIERHLLESNFMDEYTPDMARKGFEDVPMSDYCVLPEYSDETDEFIGTNTIDSVVGKQVAWLREMTAVNRVHGEFTTFGEKRDWVLTRNYLKFDDETSNYYKEISVYGNPLAYQYPFISQTLYDANFHLQTAIKCKAIRPIGRRFMPNLGN